MAIPEARNSPPPILARAQSPLSELLAAFDAIKQIGITHTNRIPTGEYGEWLACNLLDLTPSASKVTTGGDGTDAAGRGYEVKTRIMRDPGGVPTIQGNNAGRFDFLAAVSIGPSYEFQRMWIVASDLLDWNGNSFRFGPAQASQGRIVNRYDLTSTKLALVESTDACMRHYNDRLRDLIKLGVVRTEKTLAADLGEFFASCYFDIELEDNVNQPGHDAVDSNEVRYQIKTRMPTPTAVGGTFQDCFTTYTSFDFKKKVLDTKEFDSLIACFLDSGLRPIGFLIAPYEAVVRQILNRSQTSGKKPSPRYRWNWKRFQERPEPSTRLFLTRGYNHLSRHLSPSAPVELLPF